MVHAVSGLSEIQLNKMPRMLWEQGVGVANATASPTHVASLGVKESVKASKSHFITALSFFKMVPNTSLILIKKFNPYSIYDCFGRP